MWNHRYRALSPVAIMLAVLVLTGCNRSAAQGQNSHSAGTSAANPFAGLTRQQTRSAEATRRILFLGNSHTLLHNVPGLVQHMLQLADPSAAVYCDYRIASFLEPMVANDKIRKLIADGDWDAVVLQGQKVSMSGQYHYSIEAAVELARQAESAGAQVWLYSEWGRRGVEDETERIQKVYQSIADETHARISPVGRAWQRALMADADLALYAADGNHAAPLGALLTAGVLCGSIQGIDPASLPALEFPELDEKTQRMLLEIAGQTLKDWSAQSPAEQTSESDPSKSADSRSWFRGNLHTHSLWSDGDDFPEMITRWYTNHGYNFLAMTDHNILARGDRWIDEATIEDRGGRACLEKYRDVYGDTLMQTREQDGARQFRLTPLAEYREHFEKPGQFLLIEGEEVSDAVNGLPVHLNATNLTKLLQPAGGATVREAIDNNLRMVAEQAAQSGQSVMMHVNHPNFGWAITAADLAAVARARFFEVYNGHNSVNHLGDADHPSVERVWDIVNTLRIDKLATPPLFGLGTDDSHYYHGRPGSHPGRGWIMVRCDELTAEALLAAMARGDFYASSGVTLDRVEFNGQQRELSLTIVGDEGVTYQTQFIGTRRGYDQATTTDVDDGEPSTETSREDASEIGEVLATDSTLHPVYQLRGDELYVRAVVTSSRDHPDPSFANQTEQAWTQPVGWK